MTKDGSPIHVKLPAQDIHGVYPIKLSEHDRRQILLKLGKKATSKAVDTFIEELESIIAVIRVQKERHRQYTAESKERRILEKWDIKLTRLERELETLLNNPGVRLRLELWSETSATLSKQNAASGELHFSRKIRCGPDAAASADQPNTTDVPELDRAREAVHSLHDIVSRAKSLHSLHNLKGGTPKKMLPLRLVINVADSYEQCFGRRATHTERFVDIVDIALQAAGWRYKDPNSKVDEGLKLRKQEKKLSKLG